MLKVRPQQRQLRSSTSCSLHFVEPRTHTFPDRAFSAYGLKIWNKLPAYIYQRCQYISHLQDTPQSSPVLEDILTIFILCLSALEETFWFCRYINDFWLIDGLILTETDYDSQSSSSDLSLSLFQYRMDLDLILDLHAYDNKGDKRYVNWNKIYITGHFHRAANYIQAER